MQEQVLARIDELINQGQSIVHRYSNDDYWVQATLHQAQFLTYPFQLRSIVGMVEPPELERFRAFREALECMRATSSDVLPHARMGPTVFQVYFNEHAKNAGLPYRIER